VNPTVGVATAMESQPIEITQFLFSQALRIGDDEPIPTAKPKSSEDVPLVGGDRFEDHFLSFRSRMPLMQFFFLRRFRDWRREDINDLMATKFRIDMPILNRPYELPNGEYDVRLLVIPALVGG